MRTFRVHATVRNASSEARTVRIRERIPISEYSDVFVSAPELDPATEVDGNGLCTWEVAVEAGARQQIQLVYTVRSAADADLPFRGP